MAISIATAPSISPIASTPSHPMHQHRIQCIFPSASHQSAITPNSDTINHRNHLQICSIICRSAQPAPPVRICSRLHPPSPSRPAPLSMHINDDAACRTPQPRALHVAFFFLTPHPTTPRAPPRLPRLRCGPRSFCARTAVAVLLAAVSSPANSHRYLHARRPMGPRRAIAGGSAAGVRDIGECTFARSDQARAIKQGIAAPAGQAAFRRFSPHLCDRVHICTCAALPHRAADAPAGRRAAVPKRALCGVAGGYLG